MCGNKRPICIFASKQLWKMQFAIIAVVLLGTEGSNRDAHSQMCHSLNHTNGKWRYFGHESSNYGSCPRASALFNATQLYSYQVTKYSCMNYSSAVYTPRNCRMFPLSKSLQIINERVESGAITYVGDSLMCQQVII